MLCISTPTHIVTSGLIVSYLLVYLEWFIDEDRLVAADDGEILLEREPNLDVTPLLCTRRKQVTEGVPKRAGCLGPPSTGLPKPTLKDHEYETIHGT
ncbi:hypothetical protein GCM10009000_067930 [Halobacterium noricense]|uniref:Transposase n=1 Tax=Haladaptatus pallidirubidus TaxID=1008152 RepID=A0AAV3UP31_9EURY